MDGKRTVATIGLAVMLGAVAGAVSGSLTSGGGAADDGGLRTEIARLDSALEDSQRELTRAQREIVHLKDRMGDTEVGLAGMRDSLPSAEELAAMKAAGGGVVDGGVSDAGLDGGTIRTLASTGVGTKILAGNGGLSVDLPVELQKRLNVMRKAHALRALDEDERWEQAQADLGLSYNQVAELKAAIEERKEAQAGARTQTEITTEGGATTIRANIDTEKMQAAREAYEDRVADALSAEQREGWKNDGYDQAFGGGRGPTMISFTSGELRLPAPKSDEKE